MSCTLPPLDMRNRRLTRDALISVETLHEAVIASVEFHLMAKHWRRDRMSVTNII